MTVMRLTLEKPDRCDRCDDTIARKCFHEGCQRYDRHDLPKRPDPPVKDR